jgi:4-amino-4-deoxy-L-arabinose transferase-like glycosyltransferase
MRLSDRRWDGFALAAIGLGAAARAVWVFWLHKPLDYVYSDMSTYLTGAKEIADWHGLDVYTTFQPQGMHLLLAVPLAVLGDGRAGLWGAAAIGWVLAAATPFFAWRLARLLLTPAAAALTALFVAIWPLLVTDSGYFLSESPGLAFLLASLWLGYEAQQRSGRAALLVGVLAGVLGAAAVAIRPQYLLNLAIVAVPFLPRRRWNAYAAGGFAVAVVSLLIGVCAFNTAIAGRFTTLSREGGVTFYIGQCHIRHVDVRTATSYYFIEPPVYVQTGGAVASFTGHQLWDDGFFYRKGIDCLRHDGAGWFRHAGRVLADMTATSNPWPQDGEPTLGSVTDWTNRVYGYGLLPLVIVLALIRIIRRVPTAAGETALLAHLLCIVPVALVYFGDPRFRSTYDVFGFALLAAAITGLPAMFKRGDAGGEQRAASA